MPLYPGRIDKGAEKRNSPHSCYWLYA